MPLNTVRMIRLISLAIMIAASICGFFMRSSMTAMIVCAVIVIAVAIALSVVSLLFWRCPKCGRRLLAQSDFTDFCPHCGKKLDQ